MKHPTTKKEEKNHTPDRDIWFEILKWENDGYRWGDEGPVVEKGGEEKSRPPSSKNQDGNT